MFKYKLIANPYGEINSVLSSDGWVIPFDPDNTDYQAFLLWKEQGNEPLPASE